MKWLSDSKESSDGVASQSELNRKTLSANLDHCTVPNVTWQ
ncbi:hypothetical protein SAMN04487996_102257 [Dyadobacter soli]|uniref:Uncharacterized protein n=1 Tax=Dyadobacter soli TaxID=659014 RepID=A0A1G6XW46_9BACT|nr:hypothetical protein SAMN04487996_102257 [Dyadobacter soli]